jgi:hypothetical protein
MKTSNNGRHMLLVCLIVFSLAACQSYQRQVVPFKMPAAYPNATEAAGMTIAAKAYNEKSEAESAFGFDIVGAGVLPIQVIFDNKGTHRVEIVPDQTLMVDDQNNLWPILESKLAYDRIEKKTQLGKVAPEAAKYGALSGIAGAMIGAAIGIVSGKNVGQAAAMGAAVGAAAGATMGGTKGLMDTDVHGQIREDLQKRTLENRAVNPHDIAHGFLFFPGESAKPAELRLRLKEKDTGIEHALILKF